MFDDYTVEIRFTKPFQRRLKSLAKRYRQIKSDLQPVLNELQLGNFVGVQISGVSETVFKIRIANSDIPTGKRGGYRLIYQIVDPKHVLLLLIYAKSEQADVTVNEIRDAINEVVASD